MSSPALLVRLRPNAAYVFFLLIGPVAVAFGAVRGGVLGIVICCFGVLLFVLFGYPVVVSTVFRVPVVAADQHGVRFPLMGVRLSWPDVTSVRVGAALGKRGTTPLLLVFPADPEAAVRQARPWLRSDARKSLARYGTPLAISDHSLDRPAAEIAAALRQSARPQH